MEVVIKKKAASTTWKPSTRTLKLIASRGERNGGSIEWSLANGVALTDADIVALQRKHKTKTPNLLRATEVKRLMAEEKRCGEIVMALRKKYGATSIKLDHAALSNGRGGAKKHPYLVQ